MQPRECYNALLAQHLIAQWSKQNIDGFYCETKEGALAKLLELIPKGSVVSWGGSATLREIGAQSALKNADYRFLDPNDVQGGTAKEQIAHQALNADYYLMSANAIAASGELVNIDGIGNRASALIFGPKHVLLIVGINKVEPSLDAAILRAKKIAAPLTLLLFKKDYESYNELMDAAELGCAQLVVTSRSMMKGRIAVLLVGEDLGF